MINKNSKTNYAHFTERLDFFMLFIYFVLFISTIVIIYITGHEIPINTNIDGSIHINNSLCTVFFISCFFFFLALYSITKSYKEAVFFINEVKVNHKTITLKGYQYNTKWEETLDIKNTQVDILTKKRGRAPEVYHLQFTDELNLRYNINTSFYWTYDEILILYRDIKNAQKKETVIAKPRSNS